jgi:hypothetical protein
MDKIWSSFSGNSNILKFLLFPVRFTKCLGVRVPLRPPRKKALLTTMQNGLFPSILHKFHVCFHTQHDTQVRDPFAMWHTSYVCDMFTVHR